TEQKSFRRTRHQDGEAKGSGLLGLPRYQGTRKMDGGEVSFSEKKKKPLRPAVPPLPWPARAGRLSPPFSKFRAKTFLQPDTPPLSAGDAGFSVTYAPVLPRRTGFRSLACKGAQFGNARPGSVCCLIPGRTARTANAAKKPIK